MKSSSIEQIMNLKSQGMSDQEIIRNLQEQGISPKEISDALSRTQVKNAVEGQNDFQNQGMNPSMMPGGEEFQPPKPDDFKDKKTYPQQEFYMPQSPTQGFQSYSPQDSQQDFYQPQEEYNSHEGNYDTDTMIDVAEQVFAEKMSEISRQLGNLKDLKTLTESRINNIEERLGKIESMMDRLQIEILRKIGSYGDNLQSIKDEMSMMQDSFGKIVNPLMEKNSSFNVSEKTRKR